MTNDEALQHLMKTAARLGEHFDSVLILATFSSSDKPGDTTNIRAGSGNYYAQLGSALEFIVRQNEIARCDARKEAKH